MGIYNQPEKLTIRGLDVEIYPDEHAESPREWGTSVLCTAHKRYTYGGVELPTDANSIEDAFKQHLEAEGLTTKDTICIDVFLYEHSGVELSASPFTSRWDSGQLGYLYETRSNIRQEFSVKRISPKLYWQTVKRLMGEVKLLNDWAKGDVYYYKVLDEYVGNFYGADHHQSGLIESIHLTIDEAQRLSLSKHLKRLKQLMKSQVSLQYRPTLQLPGRL